jgi:hypothetical protein
MTMEWVYDRAYMPVGSLGTDFLIDGEAKNAAAKTGATPTVFEGRCGMTAVVGGVYTAKVAPMPFNLDYSGGTIRGKQKRVVALGASFFRSGVCKVGYSLDKLEELAIDDDELFTGMVSKEIGGTFTKDPRFYVVSDEPRQCVVRAIVPQFDIGEG